MLQMLPRDRHGYDPRRQCWLLKRQVPGLFGRGRGKAAPADQGPDGWHRQPSSLAGERRGQRCDWPIAFIRSKPFRTFRPRWVSQADGCGTSFASARWLSVIAWSMAARTMTGRCWSTMASSPGWSGSLRWPRFTSRIIWRRSARFWPIFQTFRRWPVSTLRFTAPMTRSRTTMRSRISFMPRACGDTDFTVSRTNISRKPCRRSHPKSQRGG